MLKKIKLVLFEKVITFIVAFNQNHLDGFSLKSYSQEGEDMILRRLFEGQESGFYVDVGAHHPKRFSNTFFFYKKGWNGINIDAMPDSMKLFNKLRSRDINLELAVSDKKEVLTFFLFNEPALNGFSEKLSKLRDGKGQYFVENTREIETVTLKEVLDANLREDNQIDFLSIDVEGLDVAVLKSNDFHKYRPKVILIELLGKSLNDVIEHETTLWLKQFDYLCYAKTVNTVIYLTHEFYKKKFEH